VIAAVAAGQARVIGVPVPDRAGSEIAVLPLQNLSGITTPIPAIREALGAALEAHFVPVLPADALDTFMRRNRMRYTGGLSGEMGEAFGKQTAARGVLVTSVDLYETRGSPRVAMTSRLISTGAGPRILWMESAAAAGDESPGFLGMGVVKDPAVLIGRVADRLAASLGAYLMGTGGPADGPGESPRRYRPVRFYRSEVPEESIGKLPRVAVLPFTNGTPMRNAGEIVMLQVVRFLANARGVDVIEPGVVRQTLLRSRFIQNQGPSIPQSDLLRTMLNADVVLFGEVDDYFEAATGGSEPMVDFTARAIDTASRQVIWSSVSHGRGDQGVFFFDVGRVVTAHQVAAGMARGLVAAILAPAKGAP